MPAFVLDPHSPRKIKGLPWVVCRYCGLVYLHNDFTRWCVRMGCDNQNHPDYQRWRANPL